MAASVPIPTPVNLMLLLTFSNSCPRLIASYKLMTLAL